MWRIQSRFQQSCILLIDQRLNANGILPTISLKCVWEKEKRMNELGITLMRFEDAEVWGDLDDVVNRIKKFIAEIKSR
mgnify:CR=1 FL=1